MSRPSPRGVDQALAARRLPQMATTSILLALLLCAPAAVAETVDGTPDRGRLKVGLALSGGGAKGIAHVGVLKVLEELKIPVDYIAGTSMGAVVGGLYATGLTADEIEEAVYAIDWDDILEDKPPRRDLSFRRKSDDLRYLADLEVGFKKGKLRWPSGLKSGQKLLFTLKAYTLKAAGVGDFDDLPIPFRCVAADIVNGDMVVLGDGDLAYAIRASMAIPALFSPVELDGRLLVDGGIVNNIPVDVVKEMGADVVIAVDISGRLARREELDSFLAILSQMTALQTASNEAPRLQMADLVIRPDVTAFKMLGFDAADELLARGVDKAREHLDELRPLTLDAAAYRRHREVRAVLAESPATIDAIRFEGNQRVDDRIIQGKLRVQPGGPLDLDELADDLGRVYGLGDFELIDFAFEEEGGADTLVIRGQEKPWGPNYLHAGLAFDTDLDGDSGFTLLLNLTATRLNARGGEWRNDLQIGRNRGISSEYYQPLDFSGGWFVAPSLDLERNRRNLFVDGDGVAELDVRRTTLALDAGYQFGRFGEVRLGLERGIASVDVVTGAVPGDLAAGVELDDVDFGALVVEGTYDRLDSVGIPRRGGFAHLRAFLSFDELGADDDYDKLELVAARFFTRGRHTVLGSLDLGWSPGGELPVYDEFTLGGFRSLSGFRDHELRGQYLGVARVGYYYRLLKKVWAGGWVEAGNVWQTRGEMGDDLFIATTLMLATETLVGPAYLAYGVADEGNDRFYLSLGRSF